MYCHGMKLKPKHEMNFLYIPCVYCLKVLLYICSVSLTQGHVLNFSMVSEFQILEHSYFRLLLGIKKGS